MKGDNTYNCYVIADSKNPYGDRVTTFVVSYPRIIHEEMLRHRMFSRNVASSRAIPTQTMINNVARCAFIPKAWQKNHKGMQGTEYTENKTEIINKTYEWITAKENAVKSAEALKEMGTTKQLINRLLEPYQWITEVITATELENFFELRCPQYCVDDGTPRYFRSVRDVDNYFPDVDFDEMSRIDWLKINESPADIHVQLIAEMMWDAYNESEPKHLAEGEWHIPFSDNITTENIDQFLLDNPDYEQEDREDIIESDKHINDMAVKISTARCARVSYLNFDGKDDYGKDLTLHDQLYSNGHASPFEHCARAMYRHEYKDYYITKPTDHQWGWCRNFRGFIQYRELCGI